MQCAAGFGLIAVMCLAGCNRPDPAPAIPAGAKMAEELAWAREKAEVFLDTLIARPSDHNTLNELTGGVLEKNWWIGSNAKDGTNYVKVVGSVGGSDGANGWEIRSESVAPDRDEALFRGVLKGPKQTTGFTLVVGKEADGKWRIAAFTVENGF